ncbi:phage portal protein [Clostridium beijerinckii]|uniref:phage portal protein n=1 Tax=Clostridium beijerinckii TaxID=1520 RepID=UPI000479FE9B|nr:phage portal protein [Clostridium beijerinckii]
MINIELLQKVYNHFQTEKPLFDDMYLYYKGDSQALRDYFKVIGEKRSSRKISVNFIKKFIKEEVSYSVGNEINYISKSGDKNVVNDIEYSLSHWSEQHDALLMNRMLTYGYAFELYYMDGKAQFCSRIITPREGYAYVDDLGNVIFFMRVFKKKFDSNTYIDVYDDANIYHYIDTFDKVEIEQHYFGEVPVSFAKISDEKRYDTIYNDIKGLQDAYETNLSDISNEISDFRNAYLGIFGFQIKEDDIDKLKELGVIQVSTEKGRAEWIIKNINDSFIQNTLATEEDKMYQLTSHINHNEKMQSNLSGLALRSRLISLEEKCKLNTKAFADAAKNRLKFLFIYLNLKKNKSYDYKDIKIKFTPNVPQDDLSAAQIIQQLGDKLPLEVALSLLSFIENPQRVAEQAKEEQQEMMDNIPNHDDTLNSNSGNN